MERYNLVVATADRFAPASDLVDDIVQLTYIEFVHGGAKKEWDLNQDFSPLLYTITKQKALLLWRKRKRSHATSIEELLDRLEHSFADPLSDAEELEEIRLRQQALSDCLKLLPEKSQRLIQDHYTKGLTIKKIGERESLSSSMIYRFFRTIRLKLKSCILGKLEKVSKSDD